MILAPPSHEHLEEFLREHLGDADLKLPPISLSAGRFARWITGALRIGAITFGHRIFIAPRLLEKDEDGRLNAPGWLVAHEAMHVVQYAKEGYLRFFLNYLRGYLSTLRLSKRWDAAARMAAYLSIEAECAAREAEHAYQHWSKSKTGK